MTTAFSQVAGGPNNMASTLKAARAALMLIPILGIHFLLMPIRLVCDKNTAVINLPSSCISFIPIQA